MKKAKIARRRIDAKIARALFALFMLIFLVSSFIGFFAPETQATLSAESFVTEVSLPSATTKLKVVDVDSEGRIFIGMENNVYRSTDKGSTWTKVLDGPTTTNESYILFVDSNDYIHADIWNPSTLAWGDVL